MTCSTCGRELPPQVVSCPFCGALPDPSRSPRSAGLVVMGQAARAPRRLPLRALGLATALVVAATIFFWPKAFPFAGLLGPEEPPCAQGQRCIVVYMTSSCPACRQSLPVIEQLSGRAEELGVGFAIIIGMSDEAQATALAAKLGPDQTYFDPEGRVASRASIDAVPTWFSLDARGRIRERVTGTLHPAEAQLKELGF